MGVEVDVEVDAEVEVDVEVEVDADVDTPMVEVEAEAGGSTDSSCDCCCCLYWTFVVFAICSLISAVLYLILWLMDKGDAAAQDRTYFFIGLADWVAWSVLARIIKCCCLAPREKAQVDADCGVVIEVDVE